MMISIIITMMSVYYIMTNENGITYDTSDSSDDDACIDA